MILDALKIDRMPIAIPEPSKNRYKNLNLFSSELNIGNSINLSIVGKNIINANNTNCSQIKLFRKLNSITINVRLIPL